MHQGLHPKGIVDAQQSRSYNDVSPMSTVQNHLATFCLALSLYYLFGNLYFELSKTVLRKTFSSLLKMYSYGYFFNEYHEILLTQRVTMPRS